MGMIINMVIVMMRMRVRNIANGNYSMLVSLFDIEISVSNYYLLLLVDKNTCNNN